MVLLLLLLLLLMFRWPAQVHQMRRGRRETTVTRHRITVGIAVAAVCHRADGAGTVVATLDAIAM